MNEFENGLYAILTNHGLPVLLIACATIFIIGVLKYFEVFRKIEKSNRKPIYLILTYAFAFGLTAGYYGVYNLDFANYPAYAFMVSTATSLIYPLYENLKLRDLLAIIGNFIIKVFAKKQLEKEIDKLKVEQEHVTVEIQET